MSSIAVRVENLSKRYQIGAARERHDTLRDQLMAGFKSVFHLNGHRRGNDNTFWALRDVGFEIKQGEVVGIIGKNGAGKSTLLKILSRITQPTEGRASIHGRVGSLLEVGTGFHQELTGRENIYLNGAILGMRKAEITRKFDEIVDFSGIEQFIDTPVKRYSSGMHVRLAFAVAAHLEPEVLIIDEVLAVGDVGFQKKCLGKMEGVAGEGRSVLFVSHNMAAVEHLCGRALFLRDGRLTFSGRTKEAIEHYLADFSDDDGSPNAHAIDLSRARRSQGISQPLLKKLELFVGDEPLKVGLRVGTKLKACVSFEMKTAAPHFDVILGFDNHLGQRVFSVCSAFQTDRQSHSRDDTHKAVCVIPSLTLVPGEYRIKVLLDIGGMAADRVENAARFTVLESDYYGTGKIPPHGMVVVQNHWHLE
jgi:lipopolysaccharide transport system ATP-binding protein